MAAPTSGRRGAFGSARPDFFFEDQRLAAGDRFVAGIDEAGRGPLAGPVTAAVVILPRGVDFLGELHDSKQLNEATRESLYGRLTTHPEVRWACAVVEAVEIDLLNILRASHEAMRRALAVLCAQGAAPCHVLIDGLAVRPFPCPQTPLVKGDARSLSIAAASVIAKVTRDRLMVEHDRAWPQYEFARHKGYPTPLHLAKLAEHGPCPIHRRSYEPVAQQQFRFE